MKAAHIKKLIPASALALSLVVFTSCRIDKMVPELEPYLQEVTGTDSTSFMSALASVNPSNTEDFKDGFKQGYAAGYAEAAKLSMGNKTYQAPTISPAPAVIEPSVYSSNSLYSTGSSSYSSTPVSTSSSTSADIPSWGYTSNAVAQEAKPAPKPAKKKTTTKRYSSSRGCAGGR